MFLGSLEGFSFVLFSDKKEKGEADQVADQLEELSMFLISFESMFFLVLFFVVRRKSKIEQVKKVKVEGIR